MARPPSRPTDGVRCQHRYRTVCTLYSYAHVSIDTLLYVHCMHMRADTGCLLAFCLVSHQPVYASSSSSSSESSSSHTTRTCQARTAVSTGDSATPSTPAPRTSSVVSCELLYSPKPR